MEAFVILCLQDFYLGYVIYIYIQNIQVLQIKICMSQHIPVYFTGYKFRLFHHRVKMQGKNSCGEINTKSQKWMQTQDQKSKFKLQYL